MTIYNYFFTSEEIKGVISLLNVEQDKVELKDTTIVPEVEIRIGKYIRATKQFNNQYDKNDPFIILLLDRLFNTPECRYESIEDTVEIKGKEVQLRKITDKNGNVKYEKKIKKLKSKTDETIAIITDVTKDKMQYRTEEGMIRFSKNYEIPIKENDYKLSKDIVFTRTRTRHNFIFFFYIISITLINNSIYEIEIEFTREFIENTIADKTKLDFFNRMKQCLSHIYFRLHSLISLKLYEQSNLSKILSNVLSNSIDVRPVNIQDKHIDNNLFTQYAITNKLDGTGYDMFINKEGTAGNFVYSFYLINSKDVFKFGSIATKDIPQHLIVEIDSMINQYIFKTEVLFEGEDKVSIYLFDVIVKGNSRELLYRINIINNSANIINQIISSIDRFKKYNIQTKKYLTKNDGNLLQNLNNLYNSLNAI